MSAVAAVIVAAGQGRRAGDGPPKAYRSLAGTPMLRRTLDAFAARAEIAPLVLVIAPEHRADCDAAVAGLTPAPIVVDGGATRTQSVKRGLEALSDAAPDVVLIHDAARPLVSAALIDRVEAALLGADAVIPALPVADALKTIDEDGGVGKDAPRDRLRAVQTPQGFRYAMLMAAYRALPDIADFTDDAAVARGAGVRVRTVPGDQENNKLTFPEDFARAERLLASGGRTAVGHGFDAHRAGPGDGVTLCGVRIAADFGLIGHSDADAGLHALTDAILGALGAGDIGDHFPPSDPQWAGADSRVFLAHAAGLAAERGAAVTHADVTLICEAPKIKPHREAMRAILAETLALPLDQVSVKATTTERMGFAGRREGIAALATATLAWR